MFFFLEWTIHYMHGENKMLINSLHLAFVVSNKTWPPCGIIYLKLFYHHWFVVNIYNWKQLRHKNALTLNSIECFQSWQAWSPFWYIYIVLGSLVQASWGPNLVSTPRTLQAIEDFKNLVIIIFICSHVLVTSIHMVIQTIRDFI